MSNLSQGISGLPFQPSYMLLPSTPPSGHSMTFWEKREKNFRPQYQQQLSIFIPSIITDPPEPLFSLLTNIPQVTFPICLKSDSLTGVSVGNLGNSQYAVTFTVETDGKNWDQKFH